MAKATLGELCDDLKATLDIQLKTLSRRLFSLEAFGIVERRSYNLIPPRVEYSRIPRGEELAPVFERLSEWIAVGLDVPLCTEVTGPENDVLGEVRHWRCHTPSPSIRFSRSVRGQSGRTSSSSNCSRTTTLPASR